MQIKVNGVDRGNQQWQEQYAPPFKGSLNTDQIHDLVIHLRHNERCTQRLT